MHLALDLMYQRIDARRAELTLAAFDGELNVLEMETAIGAIFPVVDEAMEKELADERIRLSATYARLHALEQRRDEITQAHTPAPETPSDVSPYDVAEEEPTPVSVDQGVAPAS